MTKNNLLETLKGFTEDTVKDLILPVQRQKEDKEPPMPRAPEVHILGLVDISASKKKAPYVFHLVGPGALPTGQPGHGAHGGRCV